MRYLQVMPDPQSVPASGTAYLDLTNEVAGKVVESITLKLGGGAFTRANIVQWRLKLNGKIVRTSTGPDTNTIYAYYGQSNLASELVIDFMGPWGRTADMFAVGALDLSTNFSGINRVVLEVDISGATTPTLKAWAELSDSVDVPNERPYRWIMLKEQREQVTVPAAGETDVSSMIPSFSVTEGGSIFRGIHFFAADGVITDIRVRKNGYDWFKGPIAVWQAMQRRAKRVVQANHFCFDPCLDGIVNGRVFDTTKYSAGDIQAMAAKGLQPPGTGTNLNAAIFLTCSAAATFAVQTQVLEFLDAH